MSEETGAVAPAQSPENGDSDNEQPGNEGYKAPAPKALNEIIAADTEDESLRRYKEALLGNAASANSGVIVFPDDPRNVIVQKLWYVFYKDHKRLGKKIPTGNAWAIKSILPTFELYTILIYRLVVEGREDQELDLSKNLKEIRKTVIIYLFIELFNIFSQY